MIKKSSDIKNGLFNKTNQETLFLDKEKNNDLWNQYDRESYYRAINTKISRNGLIAEYLMKIENGDLIDSSYNDNHGTTENIVIGNNNFLDFIDLNGVSSYSDVGSTAFLTGLTNFTFSCWVYINTSTATISRIFGRDDVISFGIKSKQLSFYIGDGDVWTFSSDSLGKISLMQWHHIVFVKNGLTLSTYIDGQYSSQLGSVDQDVSTSFNNDNYIIGANSNTSSLFFDGKISKIRIFNRALSQNEITNLYDEISLYDKIKNMCRILYTMNSIIGTIVYDEIGTKNATAVEIAITPGKYGNAADFGGVDSYISFDGQTFSSNKLTIALWANTSVVAGQYVYLFSAENFIFAWNGSTSGKLAVFSGASWDNFSVNAPNDGEWHHLCLVINGTSAKLYLDGFFSEEVSITEIALSSSGYAHIGTDEEILDGFFNGYMNDFTIYEKALSDEEVYYLYDKKY